MSFTGDRIACGSGSVTKVTGSLAGSLVLGQNRDRAGLKFFNNTDQAVYIGYLSASNSANQVTPSDRWTRRILAASAYDEQKIYYGPVSVVWGNAPSTGSLFITELS
jgi:hypothetical protein